MVRKFLLLLLAPCLAVSAQDIVQGEYWIDTDPGWGNGAAIANLPVQPDISGHVFPIPTASLSPGIHTIGYRTKDATGRWSHTNLSTLLVAPPDDNAPIVRTEYFFNTDPGWGSGSDAGVDGALDTSAAVTVSAAGLVQGINTLYVRSQNANGRWSHTNHAHVLVADSSTGVIVAAESFWDVDPGFGQGDPIPGWTPGADVLDSFMVVVPSGIGLGTHLPYIRTLDSRGRWSLTNWTDSVVVNGTVDVDDLNAQTGISVFPNPFTEGITVRTDDGQPMRVVLYDPQGKLVHDKVLTGASYIDLHGLARGTYTAFFWKDRERIHRVQLVKQ